MFRIYSQCRRTKKRKEVYNFSTPLTLFSKPSKIFTFDTTTCLRPSIYIKKIVTSKIYHKTRDGV